MCKSVCVREREREELFKPKKKEPYQIVNYASFEASTPEGP